jgi:hypothetical protein
MCVSRRTTRASCIGPPVACDGLPGGKGPPTNDQAKKTGNHPAGPVVMQCRQGGGLPIRAFSSQGPLDGKEIMRSNNGRRLERNRKFVDSPLEGTGFEPSVPLLGKAILDVANRRRRHERRSHLQVQFRNGNACLEWLPTAFPFVEGPRVRIRLPPAESPSLVRVRLRTSRTPAFRAGVRGLAWRPGRQRRARVLISRQPTAIRMRQGLQALPQRAPAAAAEEAAERDFL